MAKIVWRSQGLATQSTLKSHFPALTRFPSTAAHPLFLSSSLLTALFPLHPAPSCSLTSFTLSSDPYTPLGKWRNAACSLSASFSCPHLSASSHFPSFLTFRLIYKGFTENLLCARHSAAYNPALSMHPGKADFKKYASKQIYTVYEYMGQDHYKWRQEPQRKLIRPKERESNRKRKRWFVSFQGSSPSAHCDFSPVCFCDLITIISLSYSQSFPSAYKWNRPTATVKHIFMILRWVYN